MISLTSLAIVLFATNKAAAVGSAFGYATGTTGAAGVAQAIPTSAAQLKSWLEDNVTRNILLDRTYDFTDTEGTITGTVCKSWNCSPNPQLIIDTGGGCGSNPASTATWKKAGTSGIAVKSNKTILGKGTSGWIKGKGLRLSGVSNVIIQNIRISDLNAQYVWGGDAIHIENSSKVWIDHNYFKNTGRQFIVTGFGTAKQVTISNNYFDGQSTWSTGCDQHHYWALLFAGNGDQITFARNYMYYTAGRGPHIGGLDGYSLTLHMYNNYFNEISGHAIDPDTGSKILVEGNYFNKVKTPATGNTKGAAFAPTSASMNSQCSGTLGRNCVSNTLAGGSGSLTNTGSNGILGSFTASVVKSASIMDPASVPSFVTANAGLGKVN
ncbi:putative pectin lyase F-2 Short=PLF-2 [Rhizoctonia solani AG-1 IB]|uniref:pectin lyase n=1 Tax=Thanatephorus cucumeris (strain AG1-IB / isolate 7/3/14) TaxID=1108050 RepID=M5C1Q0_THACB|nr:putative pectin lyase F-2 Short=PLF-2 [Rhizoctonia solani AG-1 IB]